MTKKIVPCYSCKYNTRKKIGCLEPTYVKKRKQGKLLTAITCSELNGFKKYKEGK